MFHCLFSHSVIVSKTKWFLIACKCVGQLLAKQLWFLPFDKLRVYHFLLLLSNKRKPPFFNIYFYFSKIRQFYKTVLTNLSNKFSISLFLHIKTHYLTIMWAKYWGENTLYIILCMYTYEWFCMYVYVCLCWWVVVFYMLIVMLLVEIFVIK